MVSTEGHLLHNYPHTNLFLLPVRIAKNKPPLRFLCFRCGSKVIITETLINLWKLITEIILSTITNGKNTNYSNHIINIVNRKYVNYGKYNGKYNL